jgi:hypothetical protein
MRAGKSGKFEREKTQVLSVSLRPASIYLLNQLAVEHGGAGRAIQIAVELLTARKKTIKLKEDSESSEQHEPFSFAAFPRTANLINTLALRRYESRSNVIRACIQQLYEMQELSIADLYGPKD